MIASAIRRRRKWRLNDLRSKVEVVNAAGQVLARFAAHGKVPEAFPTASERCPPV
jgi:hypothetical protein